MSSISTDRLPIVEEVVATLTSAAGAGYGGAAALRAGMRRATDQFDQHAAAALARSLVDCLCKSPDDLRVLETLVILGLAHPAALDAHRISLVNEGRRLAILLEKAGQFERAYCLGELIAERAPATMLGVTAEDTTAVEQLVRDAELAAARGRTEAAIRCLEEAQKIDPTRTDLARAVRDLRRKQEFKKTGAKRSLRLATTLILVSGVATAVLLREVRVWSLWKTLPEASREDIPAMRARLARIIFVDSERSNWTYDPLRKAYFWHRFFHHQPDLNYDNPEVQQAMLDAVRFWIDRGADGIRVDAPPYLFEREGTNCENLPETHAFLKRLRAFVDGYAPGTMLLSEANQWPEDVRPYFGNGDEMHMNFHFPLMPRIFMALRSHERSSLEWVMARTPAIPETCQW